MIRTIAIGLAPEGAKVEVHTGPDQWLSGVVVDRYIKWDGVEDSLADSDIRITHPDYQPYLNHVKWRSVNDQPPNPVPMNHQINVGIDIPSLIPLVHALPRLMATGGGLTAGGVGYDWAHVDSFRLIERLKLGESVTPTLDQLADCGANGVRVLLDASWYRVHTCDYVDELLSTTLPQAVEVCSTRGLYIEVCAFADWQQTWDGQLGPVRSFWDRLSEFASHNPSIILQLVNEGDQHDQHFPFDQFPMPDGVLSSRGSTGTGNNPPAPYGRSPWTFNSLGTERNADKIVLSTSTIMWAINGFSGEGDFEGTRWCTVVDEPPKLGKDVDDFRSAFILGLGTRFHPSGMACGGTAHADACIQSVVMPANIEAMVRGFIMGVKAGAGRIG